MARVVELTIDGVDKSSSTVDGDGAVMGLLSRAKDARKISGPEHDGAIHLLGVSRSDGEFFEALSRANPRLIFSARQVG